MIKMTKNSGKGLLELWSVGKHFTKLKNFAGKDVDQRRTNDKMELGT